MLLSTPPVGVMRFGLLIAFCVSAVYAQSPIQSLDGDFFGGYTSPQTRTNGLDQDFFSVPNSQTLDQTGANYKCMNIVAATPMSETARVEQVISKYCGGPATRMWIPRPNGWRDVDQPNQPRGYFQICCFLKQAERRGRRD